MTRRGVAFAALVAILLGTFGYFALRPTDESRIRAKLARLAAAVHVTEADLETNPIGRFAHVSGVFEELFEPDVRVSIPELTSLQSGRRELAELVAGAPSYVRSFDVEWTNVTVKIDDARASALVGAVAKVKAVDRDGKAREDRRAVDLRFARPDGEWIITTLTVWPKDDAAPE